MKSKWIRKNTMKRKPNTIGEGEQLAQALDTTTNQGHNTDTQTIEQPNQILSIKIPILADQTIGHHDHLKIINGFNVLRDISEDAVDPRDI